MTLWIETKRNGRSLPPKKIPSGESSAEPSTRCASSFRSLFTASELRDFATRWLLVREIDKGTTQREIANKYHMSLCKITRGSRELKKNDSAFRKLLDKARSLGLE